MAYGKKANSINSCRYVKRLVTSSLLDSLLVVLGPLAAYVHLFVTHIGLHQLLIVLLCVQGKSRNPMHNYSRPFQNITALHSMLFFSRHTAIVAYGDEFFFGGEGISSCSPVSPFYCPVYVFTFTILPRYALYSQLKNVGFLYEDICSHIAPDTTLPSSLLLWD